MKVDIGALTGAGMQIAGSIIGGAAASKAMKNVKKNLAEQRVTNQNWYDRKYNEDMTQRADAQRIINMTQEAVRQRNAQSAGTAAVMGGTEESAAVSRAANNEMMANMMSQMAADAASRKDAVEQQYMSKDTALQNSINDMEVQRGQAVAAAARGVGEAGKSLAGNMGSVDVNFGKFGK